MTAAKLADNAVDTDAIQDDAVTTAKIINDAVTTDKIINDAVTAAKLADNAVDTGALQDDAVTEAKIIDDAVTTDKILNDAVTAAKLADDAVDTDAIQDDAVTTTKIIDDAVTTDKILNDAVTAAKLADDAVDTDAIQDEAVTAAKTEIRAVSLSYAPSYAGAVVTREVVVSPVNGTNRLRLGYDDGVGILRNYYEFRRSEADNNILMQISFRVTLPWNFESWQATPLTVSLRTQTTTVADNSVSVQMFDDTGTPELGVFLDNEVSTVASTIRDVDVTTAPTQGTYVAGDTVLLLFTLKSQGNNRARLYETTFHWNLQ